MISNILLIKPSDITRQTPMGGNIDVSKYANVIRECQAFVIRPLLGTKLYEKIETDFQAGTIAGVYKELLDDYLKWILIYTVSAEYILVASYNVANGGVFKNQPINTAPVSKSEVDFLVQNQREKASVFINQTREFLSAKRGEMPEYTSVQDNTFDESPQVDDDFVGGMFLGNSSTSKIRKEYGS